MKFPPKGDMEEKIFEEIGFTKGETKVYLSLLKLGGSTVGPISKKSGITMSKVYPILEKLSKKGLITQVIKEKSRYFQSLNPKSILNFIKEKKKKLNKEEERIKKIIPSLINQQKKEAEYSSRIYEGFNGMKTLYDEIIDYLSKSKEYFKGFTMGEDYNVEKINLFFHNYDAKRRERKIKTKLIGTKSQKKFLDKEYRKKPNLSIKYTKNKIPFGTIVFGDKLAILNWSGKPVAFLIQSKQTAKSTEDLFDELWKTAKP